MAQITTAHLKTLLDRVARFNGEVEGIPQASAIATGAAYTKTTPNAGLSVASADVLGAMQTGVLAYADATQLDDILPPVANLNNANPSASGLLAAIWQSLQAGLNYHMSRFAVNAMITGDRSPLDAALRVINAGGITARASSLYSDVLGGLSPANIFTGNPFVLATIAVTAATTLTFTHVADMAPLYGPGQIAILNTKAEGLTSTVFTLTCVKQGLSGATVVCTTTTQTDEWINAMDTDATQTFTDCTACSITGGNAGDTFSVVIIPDRVTYNV